jgi:general secretion pathway protein D
MPKNTQPNPLKARSLNRLAAATAMALGLSLTLGCALHKANQAFSEGRYEEAAKAYRDLLQTDPQNVKAKIGYRRAAPLAAEHHLEKAGEAERRGQAELVNQEVRKALVLDPNNAVAQEWLARLESDIANQRASADANEDIESQKRAADSTHALQLNPRSMEGIDLNFMRKTSLKEIFSVLSKAAGVNIIPHSSFNDMQVSIDLRGLTFQRALDTLMLQNDLFYKVLDANTLMIFKSSPQNRELYENQLIKTYYLSNADVDGVRQVLTTLIPQLKVFPDKRMNAITVKAKPNELKVADRIVNQLDKAKPEVMVYLELMEVTENSLEQVGLLPVISLQDAASGAGVYRLGATLDGNLNLPNQNKGAIRISKSDLKFLFPSLALDALKNSGDAKLVASPNVRVVSGEKGEVNIGEKISTTQSSIGGLGGSTGAAGQIGGLGGSVLTGATQTQFSYEDVGVKITVEPRVHHNGDITLKVESKVTTLKAGSQQGRPDLGQREIKTQARLRDGETAVFGGLLKDEEQKSLQGIWGLSDIPVLGKLLSNTRRNRAKTDVILTIRAVTVRKPNLTSEDFREFDPDRATSQEGPFGSKKAKPAPPKALDTRTEEPRPAEKPGEKAPDKPAEKPLDKPTEQPAEPSKQPEPKTEAPEAPKPDPAKSVEAAKPGDPKKPEAPPVESPDLVMFLSPLSETIAKGEKIRLSLQVSGGKGITGGSIDVRVDPKLKVVGVSASDYLTADGGDLSRTNAPDGTLKLSFKRNGTGADSGTLVILELEGLSLGNAPVLIQGGRFLMGANPITGRWVNSLITVN